MSGDLGLIDKGELGTQKRYRRNRKNVNGADKIFRKQTLESLDPLLQLNWRRTVKEREL